MTVKARVAAALLAGFLSTAAHAQLVGEQVTGTLNVTNEIPVDTRNFFDPDIGDVPAGALNNVSETVTISDAAFEFISIFSGGTPAAPLLDVIADFDDDQLTVVLQTNSDLGTGSVSVSGLRLTFASTLSGLFDSISLNAASSILDEETSVTGRLDSAGRIVIDIGALTLSGLDAFDARFDIVAGIGGGEPPVQAPEPAALGLLGLGLLGVAAARRRKKD